ncbi:MAG: hypothetical protein ACREH8_03655 [Opitutaceae bacterium]
MIFPSQALRWLVAAAVVLALSALSLRRYLPSLPNPLTIDLLIETQPSGKSEPLITSGRKDAGDFLFIRHVDGNAVVFGYETWGDDGLFSTPVPLPPDRRFHLRIEMPGLSQIRGGVAPHTDRLRIVANGTEVLNAAVGFYVRQPAEIYFAENPIGGTACDKELHGRVLRVDGRELRGFPSSLVGIRERLAGWIAFSRWQALSVVLAGIAIVVFWERLRWRDIVDLITAISRGGRAWREHRLGGQLVDRLRLHRWFWFTSAACTFSFSWMVSYGSFNLFYPETFSNFYEHQAAGLLKGRLDVPDDVISGEAFVVDGKSYGYFGITPALLRLPFVIFRIHFGELSRAFMVAYFVVTLAGCYGLLRTVYRLSGGGEQPPPAWATLCFVGGAGAGSTIFYLGSRAYVYHEAILCGIMFAVLAGWAALRHFEAPGKRAWIVALAFGILSVHARPPTGFFALTFLACMALAVLIQQWAAKKTFVRQQIVIAALCGLGVFSFNVLSYLKFKTFEGCPLRFNVQYDAARLARIDGRQFHLSNLPIAVDSYLVHANFRLERGFPYFFIGSREPRRAWLKTKIDYHDNTLGFPCAMPGLFLLATLGGIAAFLRLPRLRILILATWLAGVPMTLAMFTAIAITHRYTADFCPFLLAAAALGVVGIEHTTSGVRRLLRWTVGAGTAAAVLITVAITLHYQGQDVWGVPDEVRAKYAAMRRGVDTVVEAFRR